MTELLEAVARIARHESAARGVASVGRVTEAYSGDEEHAVTVQLRDSGLLLPRVPIAVGVLGFAAIPAVDDLVLVVFCEGDRNAPVVIGRLYHPDLNPPDHDTGQLVLSLPAGSDDPTVHLKVEPDGKKATLEIPNGKVRIEATEDTVTLAVADDLTVTLQTAGGGRIELAAGGSTLTLKKDGDVTLAAKGKLTLSGSEVAVSATAKVSVKGSSLELN